MNQILVYVKIFSDVFLSNLSDEAYHDARNQSEKKTMEVFFYEQ